MVFNFSLGAAWGLSPTPSESPAPQAEPAKLDAPAPNDWEDQVRQAAQAALPAAKWIVGTVSIYYLVKYLAIFGHKKIFGEIDPVIVVTMFAGKDPELSRLVNIPGFNPKAKTPYGFTYMHFAVLANRPLAVPILRQVGVEAGAPEGVVTPAMLARSAAMLDSLVKYGNVDLFGPKITRRNGAGYPLDTLRVLMFRPMTDAKDMPGRLAMIQYIMDHPDFKAKMNEPGNVRPTISAVQAGVPEFLNLLLKNGMKLTATSEGSELFEALYAERGREMIDAILKQHPPEEYLQATRGGATAFDMARDIVIFGEAEKMPAHIVRNAHYLLDYKIRPHVHPSRSLEKPEQGKSRFKLLK